MDARLVKLAESLIALDDDHDCRLCSKNEWDVDKHTEDCPMREAYKIVDEFLAETEKKKGGKL